MSVEIEKPILICTVGFPRSGKTTWAREQGFPIVNPDSIRLALHGQRFIGLAEPFVWAIAKTMVRALFLAGHTRVILDATNTTKARRDEWKSSSWETRFKTIDVCANVCVDRAHSENDIEIVPIIRKMEEQAEPLDSITERRWVTV